MTKYIAKHEGKIVGTRTSKAGRLYTHAIVVNGHGKTDHVVTWCSRIDLAQGEQRKYQRYGYRAEIATVESVAPSAASLARAAAKTAQAIEDTVPSSKFIASAFSYDRD